MALILCYSTQPRTIEESSQRKMNTTCDPKATFTPEPNATQCKNNARRRAAPRGAVRCLACCKVANVKLHICKKWPTITTRPNCCWCSYAILFAR